MGTGFLENYSFEIRAEVQTGAGIVQSKVECSYSAIRIQRIRDQMGNLSRYLSIHFK
jgi:hypothetical protein